MSKLASIIALAAVTVATTASAADCHKGSPEVLAASEWSARVVEVGFLEGVALSVTLENISSHDIRMIEGRIFFEDVLGRSIANVKIDEDARLSVSESFTQSGRYQTLGGTDITRLATAERADIVVSVCVEALVTTAGQVMRFD